MEILDFFLNKFLIHANRPQFHLKDLIYKTNEIELLVKKNSVLAKNILADFIINNSKKTNN